MKVEKLSIYCDIYAEATEFSFFNHIIDSGNLGVFDEQFVIDFVESNIGVDNVIDVRMPYNDIIANIGILTYHYAKNLDIVKLEISYSDIGLKIGQSCLKISRKTLAELGIW